MELLATLLLGVIFGGVFGLTGSGGSVLAVPMLVYGLGLGPHRAVCVSMIAVGAMASVRTLQEFGGHRIELRTGCVVALAGLLGAPPGGWLGRNLPQDWLLITFAGVVVLVALRLLFVDNAKLVRGQRSEPGVVLRNTASNAPALVSGSLPAMSVAGFLTGFLAGFLGIGGGFILVPALVLLAGLEMRSAIATSMFSIALISVAAMASHWLAGQRPPADTIGLFTAGGFAGMIPGIMVANRLSSRRLQQVFAVALLVLASLMAIRSLAPV